MSTELKLGNENRAHRLMGLSIRRQGAIGPFIVDLACAAKGLIPELDGWQHGERGHASYDRVRDDVLRVRGSTNLRFWTDEVMRGIDELCQHIVAEARPMAPGSAGQGEAA